jgi:hypothetical protein
MDCAYMHFIFLVVPMLERKQQHQSIGWFPPTRAWQSHACVSSAYIMDRKDELHSFIDSIFGVHV